MHYESSQHYKGDIMKQTILWKCPQCDNEAPYKGLCRDCTEYSESGKVLKPVSRVRHNQDGSIYEAPDRRGIRPDELTLEVLKQQRRNQKKLTNKQKEQLAAQKKAMQAAMKAEAAKASLETTEDGILEIGESEE